MKRASIVVSGMVQGVFFRHNTNKIANKLGLVGYVRNLDDGSLEVVAEGDDEKINELISFCRVGPSGARIDDIKIEFSKPTNEFKEFGIRY